MSNNWKPIIVVLIIVGLFYCLVVNTSVLATIISLFNFTLKSFVELILIILAILVVVKLFGGKDKKKK